MATIDAFVGLDMSTFDFSRIAYTGFDYVGTPTYFEVDYPNGTADIFTGFGFSYIGNRPASGVVTGYRAGDWVNDILYWKATGLSVSMVSIVNATLTFNRADDFQVLVTALRGPDLILGSDFNDVLIGFAGNDRIFGYAGHDDLVGSVGRDVMNGGAGSDTFVFVALGDSVRGGNRDQIQSFTHADWIDLSFIDAKTNVGGNNAFKFIGNQPFHDKAGELRFSGGIVQGDVNGNGIADFEIRVTGVAPIASDFFL